MQRKFLLFLFGLIIGCTFSSVIYAQQVKLAEDNKTITAKISAKELTRIYVEGDRIFQIRGNKGAYTLKQDAVEGAIFIIPTEAYRGRPFNVFISTEQGHNYPLLLIPIDVPAETVAIKPMTPSKNAASRWETSLPYQDRLLTLIQAMANNKPPRGYAVIPIQKTVPSQAGTLTLRLRSKYVGARLSGEVLTVTNTGMSTVQITPRQFYSKDVRAIAVANEQLTPGSQTVLYRVVNRND